MKCLIGCIWPSLATREKQIILRRLNVSHRRHRGFPHFLRVNSNKLHLCEVVEVEIPQKFSLVDKSPIVAANGFILPRRDSFESLDPSGVKLDPNSPTSFSVNGLAASSPEKTKVSQERALNEGRDFLDILEACRPRNSGVIPSALQAILKMYRRTEKIDRTLSDSFHDDADDGDADELKPLREWTSMDLDLDEPYNVIRPRSGSFGLHEKNASDRSDSSALSSPSSSYASLIGVNYDRHILGRHRGSSAPLGAVQLQRSLSLQHIAPETTEDAVSVRSDASWSTMDVEGCSDVATDEEVLSMKASHKERNKYAAQLRAIMANHDSNYFVESQIQMVAAAGPLNDSHGTLSPPHR
jgi:hypothetical protein